MLEDVYFASSLVELLEDVLVCFVHFLLDILLHEALAGLDRVATHRLEFLPAHVVLGRCELALAFDFINFGHDLPAECLVELSHEGLDTDTGRGKSVLGQEDH